MFHFTSESGYSIWIILAASGTAIILTFLLYLRSFPHLSPRQGRILLALRLVALILVLVLLFRPVLTFERDILQRRHIVFLVDSSASMATVDDASGINRYDQARTRVLDWWSKLGKDFELDLFEFSDRAARLTSPADLAQRKPTGQATSLRRALITAGQNVQKGDIEAVLLLSDGINNSAGDPALAAQTRRRRPHGRRRQQPARQSVLPRRPGHRRGGA